MLEPYRIPIGIVANAFYQPGAQGIGDHIACATQDILVRAQGMVVECTRSHRAAAFQGEVDRPRRTSFGVAHRSAEVAGVLQSDQTVPVVGHQYPAQQRRPGPAFRSCQRSGGSTGAVSVGEQGPPLVRGGGQQIQATGPAVPSLAQGMVAGWHG